MVGLEPDRAGEAPVSRVVRHPYRIGFQPCPASHTRRLFEAIPHEDKHLHWIPGASHYYTGQREELARCIDIYSDWLRDHGLDD
jgi:pimeloyl-ACP methyl ester carboxylesterase